MTFETTLSQMQNIHQTITINGEGIPTYPLSSNYHLRITGIDTEDWDVWGPLSKRIFKQDAKGIPIQIKNDLVDIMGEWNDIADREADGELSDNLKRIGFEPSGLPTEVIETPMPPEIKVTAKKEYTKPEEVKKTHPKKAKHNLTAKTEEYPDRFGMELPIVYPPEMKGQFMKFVQWKKVNHVLTTESEVLVLDEDEYNFRVNIPSAHLGFMISRGKVEIINPAQDSS